MKNKIYEYNIDASYNFLTRLTVEAKDDKEAERIAYQTIVKLCKDQLSDRGNIKLTTTKSHEITEAERVELEKAGIIEKVYEKKKMDSNKKTTKRTISRTKK